ALHPLPNPEGALPLVPSDAGEDLDDLAAVEDGESMAGLLDRLLERGFHVLSLAGRNPAIVNRDAEALGLDAHSRHGPGAPIQRAAHGVERVALRLGLRMGEREIGALDLEPVAPGVDGVDLADPRAQIGEIAPGDDREPH